MKAAIALALLTTAAVSASMKDVDWSQVKPVHIEPRIPLIPRSRNAVSGRIINGQLASEKQFPYQVALILYASNGERSFCGGSLISDRYVLTAAHCTEVLGKGVDVLLGALNRTVKEKNQQKIFVAKKNVIIHEDWDRPTLNNDISLIRLPVPIEFNAYIQPIQLPKMSGSYSTYAGDEAIASGWGQISSDVQEATDILRWIRVPILTDSDCNRWYLGLLSSSKICIKTTDGYTSCRGDSGGPLVVGVQTKTLVGINSFGFGQNCDLGFPGIFTRVTSYLDWIKEHSGIYYV